MAAKNRAIENISEKPAKVIHSVLETRPKVVSTLTTRDISYIRTNIYRARNKIQPRLPTNIKETILILQEMEVNTIRGENFVAVANAVKHIVILSCDRNLLALCNSEEIYVDGTFKCCLKYFLQLFTLHIFDNGHYIPLAFCLLPNKDTETYAEAFRLIKERCEEMQVAFNPRRVIVDFEKGIHRALIKIWPSIIIIGCRFHLGQSWFRKMQELGLAASYTKAEGELGKWLNYVFGLSYLDPDEVSECFVLDLISIQPCNEVLVKFADYLVNNYIESSSTFPPQIWARLAPSLRITTNCCESFHAHFNSNFYENHPSLFIFLNALRTVQTETYIKLQSVGEEKKIKDVKVRQRNEIIRNKINEYKRGLISRFEYVKCLGYFSKQK